MASTYTTRLRAEKQGTGENSGTWGTKLNTLIAEVMEEAIAGVAVVAMTDANYTLSTANGSTDEARRAVIKLTGALTASRNVICPTVEKLYVVYNATSGSQNIVFKTSGGTGITVAPATKRLVYCDGTNVVDTFNDLPSGTTLNGVAFGTAALVNTGTSGATAALCNGNNTFAGNNTYSGTSTFTSSLTGSGGQFAWSLGTGTAPGKFVNTNDAASNIGLSVESQRATQTAGDAVLMDFKMKNSAASQAIFSRLIIASTSITSGAETGNLTLQLPNGSGSLASYYNWSTSAFRPTSNDLAALGAATISWSDLFLASGAVINFNNGNFTVTHSAGLLTFSGAVSLGTSNAFTCGTIELGAASDTTISRSAAGIIAVEGVDQVNVSAAQTLTNKTLTSPTINGGTSSSRIQLSGETSGTLTSASANKKILASGGITLPNSVFSAQDAIIIEGNGTARTITRGAGVTMYINGTDSATGTLTANGVMGVHWRTASICILTGNIS